MEQLEQERQRAVAEVREKLRVGYEQLQRGETVDPDVVFAEIKAMSKAAREAEKKKPK
jgi:hypothetical protein